MINRLRIPIEIKLIVMTVCMIGLTAVPIAFRNYQTFLSKFGQSQDETNSELANSKAIEIDGVFMKYLEKIQLITDLVVHDSGAETNRKALEFAFGRDLDVVNIDVYKIEAGRPRLYRREINENNLKSYDLDRRFIEKLRAVVPFPLAEIISDHEKVHIQNSTIEKGMPLLSIGVPLADETGVTRFVTIADIRLDRLQKGFALGGARSVYLVDSVGRALAHSDEKIALEGRNLSESPIVQEAMAHASIAARGRKPTFLDPHLGERMVGAYARTAFGPTVFVETPERIALEPANQLRKSNFSDALQIFWIVLFFVFVFAYTLTSSIEKLHLLMLEVAQGNFDVRARIRTADEVEDLGEGFNRMVDGLKERDKVKNILNKFHGSSVTDDLMKSDLNLGGSKKAVTVFFSDIRDFTKFSESHTPEEVVEMLNEYFQIMVSIIAAHGGIVDKFVGDAIMAVWGAPQSSGDDNKNALKACLEMRRALDLLNQDRMNRGQAPIKIGMGVHSGHAISGTIGSTERMEYTVIGDTVNMASRIESSTKAFGADLLVSAAVAESVQGFFILEEAGAAEVKGKSEALRLYRVRGEITAGGEQIVVQTPYSDYEPAHADKIKISA